MQAFNFYSLNGPHTDHFKYVIFSTLINHKSASSVCWIAQYSIKLIFYCLLCTTQVTMTAQGKMMEPSELKKKAFMPLFLILLKIIIWYQWYILDLFFSLDLNVASYLCLKSCSQIQPFIPLWIICNHIQLFKHIEIRFLRQSELCLSHWSY